MIRLLLWRSRAVSDPAAAFGSDGVGLFQFEGTVTDTTVELKKQYVEKHCLKYSGTSNDAKTYTGKWLSENGASDTFELLRPAGAAVTYTV